MNACDSDGVLRRLLWLAPAVAEPESVEVLFWLGAAATPDLDEEVWLASPVTRTWERAPEMRKQK